MQSGKGEKMPPYVRRRIEFLLSEARGESSVYDVAVRYALRSITNYQTCGKDGASRDLKVGSRWISKKALELKIALFERERDKWFGFTTAEHQEPLVTVWNWIRSNKDCLTVDQIFERLAQYPVVVITKEEDASLRRLSKYTPEDRYRLASIEVIKLA
jgi:hypothetical protein